MVGGCSSLNPQPLFLSKDNPWERADAIANGIHRPVIAARDFPITDFGAREGSGVRLAVKAALEAASLEGGGRVVFPAGEWLCDGPIHMRERCALHLEEGARLVFSGNADSYLPVVFTRWEGTEVYNYSPMIYARGLKDVAITGAGTIDGQGKENFLPWRPNQKPDQRALRKMGAEGVPVSERIFGEGHFLRPHFIQFVDCERVLVEGVKIVDSPFWCVHPVYCRHVTVKDVTIISHHINSDGIDPDSSEDVLIESCTFDVGDDGVALKAGRDQDGWRVGRKTRRVVVRDCIFTGVRGGGMAIGSEMSGGVEEIFVENYQMNQVHHGLYFKANLDRGGSIRDVHIRNIDIAKADTVLIFTNDYHSYRGGSFPTTFEDVTISDVRCDKAGLGISIIGHIEAPVRRVEVTDMTIASVQLLLQVKHVEDLSFHNVIMNGAAVESVSETAPETFEWDYRP